MPMSLPLALKQRLIQVSADLGEAAYSGPTEIATVAAEIFASGGTEMTTSRFTLAMLLVATLAAPLALQGCNTTAGIGKDVSAGANAVTKSAEKHKSY